ncbi:MAG: 50S ribosomal protein L18 [Bacteroidia bacterium]|jgi:large subunit ribosomal protein L18|nr:50S ribosomal protein L18 [Bacteroidia bacterium]GIV22972.1 MAG: 50S ribosomal protein L18 [Bacteroidia bacterium]
MQVKEKRERRLRIKWRIRKKVRGTAERPRLSVFRSNKYIYAQLIDDERGVTLVSASAREAEIQQQGTRPLERSRLVGLKLAERAKGLGIEKVVFDRNGYKYHGNVRALAEGAREGGLLF